MDALRPEAEHPDGAGNPSEASDGLQTGLDVAPTDLTALVHRAAACWEAKRADAAEAIYLRILDVEKGHAQAHLGLAWIAQSRGQCTASARHFAAAACSLRASLAAAPDNHHQRVQLANALRGAGQFDEAAALCHELLRDGAGELPAHLCLGWIAQARGDPQTAIRHFRAATDCNPADPHAPFALARLLLQLNRHAEAEELYRLLAARAPHRPDVHRALGTLARRRKDWPAAADHLRNALQRDAANIDAALELAETCCEMADWGGAEATYRGVMERAPECVEALLGLGEAAKGRGHFAAALDLFERAASAAPLDYRPKHALRKLRIAEARFDWRNEIAEAVAVARSPDAVLAAQIEAADTLVEYGLTAAARPLLMRIEDRSKEARKLLLAVRQMERMGLAQPLPAPGSAEDPEASQLDALCGLIEKPVAGADTLLLVFGGTNNRLWMTFSLLHRVLQPLGVSIVYARDIRQDWYFTGVEGLGGSFDEAAAGLRVLARRHGARRILAMGNCVGCLAALRFGLALGAQGVLGLSPKLRPALHLRPTQTFRAAAVRSRLPSGHRNVHAAYLAAEERPHVTLIYGEKCAADAADVQFMADVPSVATVAIPGSEDTDSVKDLLVSGLLTPVLQEFVASGRLTPDLQRRVAAQPVAATQ